MTSRQRAGGRNKPLRPRRCARSRRYAICGLIATAGALVHVQPAIAQQQSSTIRDTYGEVGILDMPSAHMAPDGQLAFTVGDVGTTQRFNLAFQALPWLETSFRYSHVVGMFSGYNDKHFYDRSFGLKIRLSREGTIAPDISLGIRDLLGTGIYSSEYLAASKHVGNLDFTAGLGWGRLADNGTIPNPFGYVLSSFKTRTSAYVSTGGVINFKQFFHGPRAGVFGGVAWRTPIDNLTLLAEYSSDKYTAENSYPDGIHVRTPFNVGLSYRLDALSLTGGWFYGTTYGFMMSLRGAPPAEAPSTMRIGPVVPPPVVRNSADQQLALSMMLSRNADVATTNGGGPWIRVPTAADRARQDLQQALFSESRGVRDVDMQGETLVVDARGQNDAQRQCVQYAEIAASVNTRATSIAMADLQSNNGLVTFCPIMSRARYTQDSAQEDGETVAGATASNANQVALEKKLRADMDKQSLYLDAMSLGTSEVWVYYDNGRYRAESEAAARIARLLMADAPPSIEIFHLIPTMSGVPTQEITIARSALERATLAHDTALDLGRTIALSAAPLENPALDRAASRIYPYFYWSLDPKLTEHIFDPDSPLQFMAYAEGVAGVQIAPGLTLGADLTANIWNNYALTRPAGSVLPHVRTDLLQYIKEGSNGISSLEGDYQARLARDVFGEVKAGYLEDMYMGAGGEILWRPEGSRIAIGADLYQVWKRDFNRLFGVQNYNILTGHATIYYQSPWYGLNFNLHVGRYLAGDYGATFEITRRFASGVEIGAWATFTNVPFSQFGEGSFDKGIIIHIPFEWGLPIYSQSSYNLRLASLTRDGGQRLAGDDSLYEETRRTSDGEIAQHFDDFVEP